MTNYFRAIEIDEDGCTEEAVSYVGVHPITWHRHPAQPQIAFVETDIVDELLEACESARGHLQLLVAEGILEYVNTEVLDAAIAKAKGELDD